MTRTHYTILSLGVVTLLIGALAVSIAGEGDEQSRERMALDVPNGLGQIDAFEPLVEFGALSRTDAQLQARILSERVRVLSERAVIADRPYREPIVVELSEGQTLQSLRRRWSLRRDMLQRLNSGVDLDNVEAGVPITVWAYEPDHPSRSIGRPNSGRLQNGELMPTGEGWVIRDDRWAYGTAETIDALVHAIRVTLAQHPDGGQDIQIADISKRRGGRFRPHKSHQSGRDVDLTYYRLGGGDPVWARTRPAELDLPRTWTFVRTLLTQHDVTYIFMCSRLIRALYAYAASVEEHPAFLAEHFQSGSNGHRNGSATIRYAPGHDDHMHIRFGCAEGERRCRGAR